MAWAWRYRGYAFVFRVVPTLITLSGMVILLALGFWQLERLAWKTAINQQRQNAVVQPPKPIPQNHQLRVEDAFHPVQAEGRFLHDKEMYLAARSKRGSIGYHLITPFVLADKSGVVLVNRGWIPSDYKNRQTRSTTDPEGQISIEGLLRFERQPNIFVPNNDTADNFWFFIDIDAMAAYAAVMNVRIFYIELFDSNGQHDDDIYPLTNQSRVLLPNDHFHYALFWFSLSLALLVIYVLSSLRKES